MSLLTIVQGASLRCGMATPVVAFSNPDPTVQQFVAYSQDAGDEYAERWTWRALKKPHTATPQQFVGDGTTVIFPMPSDWARLSPSVVLTSSIHPTLILYGPINEDDLLRFKQLPLTPLPPVWRLFSDLTGNPQIEFYPAPALGEIISYVYGTKIWILDDDQNPQTNWTSDGCTSMIPERLIRLGTIWKWKKSKGLDYSEEFRLAEMSFDRLAGQEGTGRTVSMARGQYQGDAIWWPGTITDNTFPWFG